MHFASSYFELLLLSCIDNFLRLASCDLLLSLVLFLHILLNIFICICIFVNKIFASIVPLYCKPKVQVGCLLSLCDSVEIRISFSFKGGSESSVSGARSGGGGRVHLIRVDSFPLEDDIRRMYLF